MATTPTTKLPSRLRPISLARLQELLYRIVRWLSTAVARTIFIALVILWLGYLLYTNIWQTLNQELALPGGVSQRNPVLERTALEQLKNQRLQREQSPTRQFTGGILFQPVRTTQPVQQ